MRNLNKYFTKIIFILGFFSALPFFFIPYAPFVHINIFYIVGSAGSSTFVIYSGLFKILDSPGSIADLNQAASKEGVSVGNGSGNNSINSQMSNSNGASQEIKLDPTINSSVKDLISKPISSGTLPKAKPTAAKDAQDLVNNIKGGKYK